jgi:GTPase SAR1 family protein
MHGMRLWTIMPEQLHTEMTAPAGEQREVVLWDLGGQSEYRLVHQLFLHDTTLALILLDPTRDTAFEDVLEWNVRLERQLRGRPAVKLLVGTKEDQLEDQIRRDLTYQPQITKLLQDCSIAGFYSTSAKANTGIEALRTAIAQQIDWQALSQTTRPRLFQRIREAIAQRRNAGEVVLLYSELVEYMRDVEPEDFHAEVIDTVVRQLAYQGVLVDTNLATGERALVLRIGYIERYAGSLIRVARTNLRGVPALEVLEALFRTSFPGIKDEERLNPFQERSVLECVMQLLLEHGIRLKHEGLLIFPALFPSTGTEDGANIIHTVSLYYDFSGAIDNIYSSLVVRLALSERFGRVRLSKDRAEFEHAGQGVCGLRNVDRRSGLAHLDLLFGEQTSTATRDLFTIFVEEHLAKEGVTIKEVLEMVCGRCKYRYNEALVRDRIELEYADVVCPRCELRLPIEDHQ